MTSWHRLVQWLWGMEEVVGEEGLTSGFSRAATTYTS